MPLDEKIHIQMSKIGLVAADISKAIASPESATKENFQILADRLEIWRTEVPSMLSISSLTSPNPPPMTLYQRRAILMVHVSRTKFLDIDISDPSLDYVPWRSNAFISTVACTYSEISAY